MITELSVENLKGFKGRHSAPLAPLTMVFGANSSGKSALVHALALLAQSVPRSIGMTSAQPLLFSGDWVDLGGFRNCVHQHDETQPLGLGVTVLPNRRTAPGPLEAVSDVKYFVSTEWDRAQSTTRVRSASIHATGLRDVKIDLSRVEGETDEGSGDRAALEVDVENLNQLFEWMRESAVLAQQRNAREGRRQPPTRLSDMSTLNPPPTGSALAAMFDEYTRGSERWTTGLVGPLPDRMTPGRPLRRLPSEGSIGEAALERNLSSDLLEFYLREGFMGVVVPIRSALRRVSYLGPMRAAPQRLEDTQSLSPSETGADGSGTTVALHKNPYLAARVNEVLAQLGVPYSVQAVPIRNEAFPTVGEYLALQLEDLRSGVQVSPRDVGYGISQMLPVIVESQRLKDGTLIVEQPELHLHPRLQAELATVLAQAAVRGGGQIIVETHSENMILRVQRMMREGHLSPDQVRVLYVGASDNLGSWIEPIGFTPSGALANEWPGGFFEERMREW